MAAANQLIFRDENLNLPDEYTVPASLSLSLSSVFARFDGSGAAGSFYATLDLLSQDGHIMARVAARQQILAAGDLARVTWAPFLRSSPAATTPSAGQSYEWGNVAGTNTVTVNNNVDTTVSWASSRTPAGNTIIVDNQGVDPTKPFKLMANGWYLFTYELEWTGAAFNDHRLYSIRPTGSLSFDTSVDGLGALYQQTPGTFNSGSGNLCFVTYCRASGGSPVAHVQQASGAGRDLNTGDFTVVYLGPSTDGVGPLG